MVTELEDWCERELGSGSAEVFFRADSMSSVSGVRLADGRRHEAGRLPSHTRPADAVAIRELATASAGALRERENPQPIVASR